MASNTLEITPETKVFDLLESHPELEDTLISLAKPFEKLRNPFLRKTVAKMATIKNIASVGGIPLDELISKINGAIGHSDTDVSYTDEEYFTEQPPWFSTDKIKACIVENELDDKNKMTLVTVLKEAKKINPGEIIELITDFLPAVGIDIVRAKGYSTWSLKEEENLIKTYLLKN